MEKFYTLRRGTKFEVGRINAGGGTSLSQVAVRKFIEQGWEIGHPPFDTREEAQKALDEWKARFLNQS